MASGTSLALPYPTPTRDFSSPTTTRAVNEKRRPPLTTLATRLISTTRSCRSGPARSVRSPRAMVSRRGYRTPAGAPGPSARRDLEAQPTLAGALGEGAHAAVVAVAAAVEHACLDAALARAPGEQLAGPARLLGAVELAQVGLDPRDRGERVPRRVVDELG